MKTFLSRTLLVAGVFVLPASAGNQVLLRNLDPADGMPEIVAADQSGHVFVVSTLVSAGAQVTRVVKVDVNGARMASKDLPQLPGVAAAVTDAQGNLIVTGTGAVLKLDSQLQAIVFSKQLPAYIGAVTTDSAGNIYLTGSTSSASFPVTADAYQTKTPGGDIHGNAAYAFLTKLSPGGDQVLYSTYFGDDATNCIGGSSCIGAYGGTNGVAIALDSSGGVVIAGTTNAFNLPTTAGALSQTCDCWYRAPSGFVAKIQPGAKQQLVWSTFLNGNPPGSPVTYLPVRVNSMGMDAAGNVIVAGIGPSALPTTAGTLQPAFPSLPGTPDAGGFVIKLSSTGAAVLWGTYFGNTFGTVQGLHVDAQGRPVFTGTGPTRSGAAYVARLSSDGATLVDFYPAPDGVAGTALAINSAGTFTAVGRALWVETSNPGPSLLAVTNAASNDYSGTVAPVELVSIYGAGFGMPAPLSGEVRDGAFTTSLGGIQVFFGDTPAPLLYADSGQINAVVPRGVGASTQIRLVTPAGAIDGPTLPVVSYVPGIFQDAATGLAAALNQDGTINSAANPAPPGSVVTVFATGCGENYYHEDGALVPVGIYEAQASVWVGGMLSFEVEFAGDAPGLVSGVMQINFRVPDAPPPGGTLDFGILIGGVRGGPGRIAITP